MVLLGTLRSDQLEASILASVIFCRPIQESLQQHQLFKNRYLNNYNSNLINSLIKMPAHNSNAVREEKHVATQFQRVVKVGATDRAICNHCGEDKAWNITQFCKKHLKNCKKYQE